MKIDIESIKTMLGINEPVRLTPEDMARSLTATFFPYEKGSVPDDVLSFVDELKEALIQNGVKIIPYNDALEKLSIKQIIRMVYVLLRENSKIIFKKDLSFFRLKFGPKIKPEIAVFSVGEGETNNLPIDNVSNLKSNPIVTIIPKPKHINSNSTFYDHLNTSLDLFAWTMSNLLISVSKESWTLYSYNMSYPTYSRNDDLKKNILRGLLPKVSAPVRPPKMSDFEIRENAFDPMEEKTKPLVTDLVKCGSLFKKTNLYPSGKSINDLKFRNNFYKWLGSILLDKRNGMSYGYVARQLPTQTQPLKPFSPETKSSFTEHPVSKNCFIKDEQLHVIINLKGDSFIMQVPEIWVLTSRSGSDKTNLNLKKDVIKMGLVNGKMIFETSKFTKSEDDYKPSFDTKVIFAHALSNAILASVLKHIDKANAFVRQIETNGLAIAHWHGYFDPEQVPDSLYQHGQNNPTVSCSAPQAAIYAFEGKISAIDSFGNLEEYAGDIHIEPHHGVNVTYSSLCELAMLLLENPNMTTLGNKHLRCL